LKSNKRSGFIVGLLVQINLEEHVGLKIIFQYCPLSQNQYPILLGDVVFEKQAIAGT